MAQSGDLERRTGERSQTNLSIQCRVPATPRSAVVRNISSGGCQLVIGETFDVGTTIVVSLPYRHSAQGMVVWSNRGLAGVRFDVPIATDLVAAIAALPDVTLTAKVA